MSRAGARDGGWDTVAIAVRVRFRGSVRVSVRVAVTGGLGSG